MYDIESFYQASDVKDAIRALRENPDAVLISGGTDVLIQIREGKRAGCSLVSIHGLPELTGIAMGEDGAITIGPATVFSHITNHEIIKKYIPVLGEAVDTVGGPQIRNMGTIGGNVCNGVTSADSASTLFALAAVLELTGQNGVRSVPIREFYTGPGRTVREHDEILTAIRITKENYQDFAGCYMKYGKRNAMEIATLGCCAMVKLDESKKKLVELRLSYGVAAPTPIRCVQTEQAAAGADITPALYETVGRGALSEVNPRSSWRASKEFRLQLVEELAKRALRQAIINGGGEADA